MLISILTLFPQMFFGPFDFSIVKKAREKNKVDIRFINIRDFATDKYGTVDDRPFGGGVGMILKVDVIDRALDHAKTSTPRKHTKIVLLEPRGQTYTQKMAQTYSLCEHLIIICGHYEGVDARTTQLADEVISIGDYVLTGGEIPAMVLVDSVVRLIPGVLPKPEALTTESHTDNALEYPQYTRPQKYKGMQVPQTLLSGDHKKIEAWKRINTTRKKTDSTE